MDGSVVTDNITLRRAAEYARVALDRLLYCEKSCNCFGRDAIAALDAALAEPSLKVRVDSTAFTASAFSQAAVLEQAEAFETAYQTKRAALDAALAEPDAIARAVEAEREACAKLCDGWTHADGDRCAAAIRARGSK
jgi:hypothetical protein